VRWVALSALQVGLAATNDCLNCYFSLTSSLAKGAGRKLRLCAVTPECLRKRVPKAKTNLSRRKFLTTTRQLLQRIRFLSRATRLRLCRDTFSAAASASQRHAEHCRYRMAESRQSDRIGQPEHRRAGRFLSDYATNI
jgi:hypothetical protein